MNKYEKRADEIKKMFTFDQLQKAFYLTEHDENKMCELLNCTKNEIYRWIKLNNYEKYDLIPQKDVQEFRMKKARATSFDRYGTENPTGHPDIREKIKKTIAINYGQDYINVNQIPAVQKKKRITSYERHGVSHPSKLQEIKDKKRQTYNDKYGVSNPFLIGSASYVSKMEKEIVSYIKSIYHGEIKTNTQAIIYPFELDIYIPEHNLAIEFNGNYWHSAEVMSQNTNKTKREIRFYHQNKFRMCEEKNITLYSIWEYDWTRPMQNTIIKSQLRYLLHYRGKEYLKISAHKCELKRVSKIEARSFLNRYHIQGASQLYTQKDNEGNLLNFGLYYKDELMSLMTFGKWRRGRIAEYEIFRLCNKSDVTIIGGPQKMFNSFIKNIKPYSVGSYSSCSVGRGLFHEKLGFEFLRFTEPAYVRVNAKGEIKTLFSKDQTGYKIYTAGNKLWLYKNNE